MIIVLYILFMLWCFLCFGSASVTQQHTMHQIHLYVVLVGALFSTLCHAALLRIVDYNLTTLNATDAAQQWTLFDFSARSNGTVSSATNFDDNPTFDPVNYTAPFYQLVNPAWYISSNGFISPVSAAMCAYYCSNNADGEYNFQLNGAAGADWPSIQLYTADLDPSKSGATGQIFKFVYNKSYGGEVLRVALVDYRDIKPFTDTTTTEEFSGQVELWPNGTIIKRYIKLFTPEAAATKEPTVGLAYTNTQRKYVPFTSSVRVIRYDPVFDLCNTAADCATCTAAPNCAWCDPQKLCVSRSVAGDYCAASQQNSCTASEVGPQQFYALDQYDGDVLLPSPFLGNSTASFRNGSGQSLAINTTFPFPLFYNPPDFNVSNANVLRSFFMTTFGLMSFTRSSQCPFVGNYCPAGNYLNVLLGVSTYNRLLQSSTPTNEYTWFSRRQVGDAFCGPLAASNGTCPAAVAVSVKNLQHAWSAGVQAGQRWQYVMLLDEEGRIAIRYTGADAGSITPNSQVPLPTFPLADMGLIRNGLTDNASIVVPWSSVAVGTTLVFRPLPTCRDCGIGGECNRTSRECVCRSNFVGEQCEDCAPGYYGAQCAPCTGCNGRGSCVDGRSGTGACNCTAPYSGFNCSIKCEDPPYTCAACNTAGGYCQCGTCICNVKKGWGGRDCSAWSDPCYSRSLDGCPVCTASVDVECRFCRGTGVCVANPNQAGIGRDNFTFSQCAPFISSVNDSACVFQTQTAPASSGVAVIIVIIIFGGLGFSACFILIFICAFRKPRVNYLIGHAVTGTPNFQFPRREREVIQMVILPREGKNGKPVQGIPLKQIPLKDLYAYQQERRRMQTTSNIRDWDFRRE